MRLNNILIYINHMQVLMFNLYNTFYKILARLREEITLLRDKNHAFLLVE